MKLVIQIPCYNEAEWLGLTLAALPKHVEGFDSVEVIVIDDGSSDQTSEVARKMGVATVVRHVKNQGLARAFMTGLQTAIARGADVIVNTDADNQYNACDIPLLVYPILSGKADIVIGARPIDHIRHFSRLKKLLQKIGSWTVRTITKTTVSDAPSGFRAISRRAAQRIFVFHTYTYTLETLIQASQSNMAVTSVPVRVNPDLRPSRLVKSNFAYIMQSAATTIRIFIVYRPMWIFGQCAAVSLLAGFSLGARFLLLYFAGEGRGHIQSLILAGLLIGVGVYTMTIAFVCDLLAANRKLLEDIRLNAALKSDACESVQAGEGR